MCFFHVMFYLCFFTCAFSGERERAVPQTIFSLISYSIKKKRMQELPRPTSFYMCVLYMCFHVLFYMWLFTCAILHVLFTYVFLHVHFGVLLVCVSLFYIHSHTCLCSSCFGQTWNPYIVTNVRCGLMGQLSLWNTWVGTNIKRRYNTGFSRGIADYVKNLKLRLHVKTKRSGRCVKDVI